MSHIRTVPFGYAGQYSDPTTGLSDMRARWYQPQTGGFTSQDPAYATTDTAYTYASGDPVNQTDPLGLFSLIPFHYARKAYNVATSRSGGGPKHLSGPEPGTL